MQIYYFFLIYANYAHINHKERAYVCTRVLCSPSPWERGGVGLSTEVIEADVCVIDAQRVEQVAVGFIFGVVQDSVETALNSSGDVFFTATAEKFDRKGKGE